MRARGSRFSPPRGRVPRDAGIHHAIAVTSGLQPLAQQRNPGFLLGNAERGTEAVTHHEHGLVAVGLCRQGRSGEGRGSNERSSEDGKKYRGDGRQT